MFELEPPPDDGLTVSEVGSWSNHKHHFLRRYMDAFTTSMKKKRWSGLHYVDLFAGPGIEKVRDGGLQWGSPLIAAQLPNKFTRLHLCELDQSKFKALEVRVARFEQPEPPQMLCGDANQVVDEIVATIPEKALVLGFLDPTGLHLWFETVRVLSARRADLIIYFPDHVDANRNWKHIYQGREDSNLSRVMGSHDWLDRISKSSDAARPGALCDMYIEKIATLGYKHFASERISRTDGVFLYRLIFCSRHQTALKIWQGVSNKDADGQYRLGF